MRSASENAAHAQILAALRGKKCWYVSCGGSAGTTFQLALGERVRRSAIINNTAHSEEFRAFEGEANLLVWCSWRLDGSEGPLSSSDDTMDHVVQALSMLADRVIDCVAIDMPGWDLRLEFNGGLVIKVFCDHVPGDPSFDGNWDLFLTEHIISIGAGSVCEIESRQANAAAP